MKDYLNKFAALLAALGIGAGAGYVAKPVAPTTPATVNRACPTKTDSRGVLVWRETAGTDPKLAPIDVRGAGVSEFVVCERVSDGTQISIFANGTVSGTNRDGSPVQNPSAVLNADR